MEDLDLSIFPKVGKQRWIELAKSQLKGLDPAEKLGWTNTDATQLQAYYDASDTKELTYLKDFFQNITHHAWKLYERVKVNSESSANKDAIEALMGGCDGIIFDLASCKFSERLLEDIDTTICDISIINAGKKPTLPDGYTYRMTDSNSVFKNQGINSDQIVASINQVSNEKYLHRIANTDFFLEIATVRALRYLLDERGMGRIHIHTQIPVHNSEDHQWFLNTTAGLASILGGSHSVDFSTSSGDSRISRNIGNLIREESGITEYTDQCGGSYYVEVLTDHIIQAAKKQLSR